jgi:hypothetical protein
VTELRDYEQQLAEAEQELETAANEHRRATNRRMRAQRQRDALHQIVDGLRALADAKADPQTERLPVEVATVASEAIVPATANGHDAPRGREAVRRVMATEPGRAWKQSELIAAITDHGWIDPNAKDPNAAIRIAVRRLADAGEVEKVEGMTGVYRYKDSGVTTPAEATRGASESEIPTGEGV